MKYDSREDTNRSYPDAMQLMSGFGFGASSMIGIASIEAPPATAGVTDLRMSTVDRVVTMLLVIQ